MAEMVDFPSNGTDARGYLVLPDGGTGPGVIVIQEWWGLDSGTKEMAERLAAAGFVALAPDLYHGELAAHDEMDKAGQLMQELTFVLAAERPDRVKAAVPFDGFPPIEGGPADLSKIEASIQGHMAEHDDFFPPDQAAAHEAHLLSMGKDVTITVHEGTGHAFMAPHNALGNTDEAKAAEVWPQVTKFLHDKLA